MTAHPSHDPHPYRHGWVHHTDGLWAAAFGQTYRLSIYTPPDYGDSDRAYPVAYMFDGQNAFFDGGTHKGGWHAHAALDQRWNEGKAVPIVVAIHNGGLSRMAELSPWEFMGHQGRGDEFLDWLVGSLAHEVHRHYRVLAGPEHTMIGGSSLGGLMAAYALFRHPRVFGKVMAMSASIFVDPAQITHLCAPSDLPWPRRVYLDAGGREPGVMAMSGRFAEHLRTIGFRDGHDLMWWPDEHGAHEEPTWRRHLPVALSFLYD